MLARRSARIRKVPTPGSAGRRLAGDRQGDVDVGPCRQIARRPRNVGQEEEGATQDAGFVLR